MTKLLTTFTNHFHTIITLIFSLIVLYIVLYPYYLEYYFENSLGRASLIMFIIAMTYCNPMLGALATVAFIGLYNSCVIEGFDGKKIEIVATSNKESKLEPKTTHASMPGANPAQVNAATDDKKKPSAPLDKSSEPSSVPKDVKKNDKKDNKDKKEGFNNRLAYAHLDEGRNRMLTIENYMRIPKSSNQLSFSKYNESKIEPSANNSGKEGLQSACSLAK